MKKKIIIFFLFLIIALSNLWSFKLQPISMDFKDEGKDSIKYFTAKNTKTEQIALKIEIFSRDMDKNGNDKLVLNNEDFFIYPKQFIVKGNSEQRIRIKYQGDKIASNEKSYRIIVEQVPIDFDSESGKGGINILYRYIGSIYIIPDKLSQDVKIIKSQKVEDKLVIEIENQGNSHVIMQNLHITLKSGPDTLILKPEDLQGLNETNILSGITREYVLDWPKSFLDSIITTSIEYETTR